MNVIIFTDLDGTLLNRDGYSFRDALPSLSRIISAGIPLILTTSKTRLETEYYRNRMGIESPFIVENGAAVFFPACYGGFALPGAESRFGCRLITLGVSYEEIRRFFTAEFKPIGARGFGDMSVEEIASLTGLQDAGAMMAKSRDFTEPFVMDNPQDMEALNARAGERGLQITRGGRFYHLIGAGQDKGKAVRLVRNIFEDNLGEKPLSVGLGDAENDLPMLREVDIPVLIPQPGEKRKISLPGLIKADKPGPQGWNRIIGEILDELEAKNKGDIYGSIEYGAA